jgi:hypothetical protein
VDSCEIEMIVVAVFGQGDLFCCQVQENMAWAYIGECSVTIRNVRQAAGMHLNLMVCVCVWTCAC